MQTNDLLNEEGDGGEIAKNEKKVEDGDSEKNEEDEDERKFLNIIPERGVQPNQLLGINHANYKPLGA